MKPFALLLSLAAALAAMPAMAQDNGSPQKPIEFEIGDQDADFGFALVSLDNGTVPLLGDPVLSNAIVLLMGKKDAGFACLLDLPMQADLWWQGVTYDLVDGMKIHPIQKLAADHAGKIDESYDETAKPDEGHDEAGERPVAGQVMGAGSEPAPTKEGAQAHAPLPIELSFLPGDDGGPGSVLQATLIAPTNDYNLVLVRVDFEAADADGGGKADVYLYRKVPGEGQGMLDIVEEHTVTADVSGAKTVRVFLATGKESRPGVTTAWRFLTEMAR
ncbi:MAG TPA: hypothetical protein VFD82_00595 [Planctomycetota bacterium]|nr:hypothetical protein [Planctomycetota bacterium]